MDQIVSLRIKKKYLANFPNKYVDIIKLEQILADTEHFEQK